MESRRKRRRKACPKCGKALSYSWARLHEKECGKNECGKKRCATTDSTVSSSADEDVNVDASTISISADDTEPLLNSSIAQQLFSVMEETQMDEEDISFFEEAAVNNDNDNDVESQDNTPPATETWDDEFEEAEEMFDGQAIIENDNAQQQHPQPTSNSKVEALVLWLMLFLSSWQSTNSITDTALTALIKFLCKFFWLLGAFDNTMALVVKLFPDSHYKFKKALGLLGDDFTKFVVCPKCKSLYKFEDCIVKRSGQQVSAKCTFVAWPNHPHRSKRGPCGEFLLKTVRSGSKKLFYPRMVYPYYSPIKGLQSLLKRPGFWQKCQEWRKRNMSDNCKADIFDGDVWRELSTTGYMSSINSLGLILNCDWFRPHKHSPGSVGVLYLAVLDLPRHERYKLENILVVGILPGPSEPKLTANTFLKPLVDDLKQLWQSRVRFSVSGSLLTKQIKVGLVCVSCDIPAIRKIGGFMGHMANQGCSKCKKAFYRKDIEALDFSGFDRSEWERRTSNEHKMQGKATLQELCPTRQQEICSKHGARYSVLHELEYFDCIKYFVIDPMHNLYLGTAKHMFKNIWCGETPLLSTRNLETIQERVDNMITPQDIGRIPGKITTNFSGFTADQWQSWVVVYSLYALQGILPEKHLHCWRLFVKACKLFGKKTLTQQDIDDGDLCLIQFLKEVEAIYGKSVITPNMHLHCHLKGCVQDYGPFHGFWCYSFERYNGILGSYNTNNKSIEVQLMRRFLMQIKPKSFVLPDTYHEEFTSFFKEEVAVGSLKSTNDPILNHVTLERPRNVRMADLDSADWSNHEIIKAVPPIKDNTLDSDDLSYLKIVYAKLLGLTIDDLHLLDIPHTISKFLGVQIGSVLYGSMNSRTTRNSYFRATWAGTEGRLSTSDEPCVRPGEVQFFFRHRIRIKPKDPTVQPDRWVQFYMARVNWFTNHPDKTAFGDSLEIWCDHFDVFGPSCFIPIKRFQSRFALGRGQLKKEKVLFVSSIPG